MANNNEKKSSFFGTLWRWIRRAFFGGGNELAKERAEAEANLTEEERAQRDVEEIVSPVKQVFRNFMGRKLAVAAVCIVIAMFLLVLIGPLFMEGYTDDYTEITQKNLSPGFPMLSVPDELAKDVKTISSFGAYSVGVSNAGKVYVWGKTALGTTGLDVADIPEEVKNDKIALAAAGIDHIIAIGESGKIYGWGNDRLGQFGYWSDELAAGKEEKDKNPNIAYMPEELKAGINAADIKKLECGYQCSFILMNDGTLYIWGNKNAYSNLEIFTMYDAPLQDITFTLNYIVGVPAEGKSVYLGIKGLYNKVRGDVTGEAVAVAQYLGRRTIVACDGANNNVGFLLSDGSVCFAGDFSSICDPVPQLPEGEKFTSLAAGGYHYVGLTDKGNVYAWGEDVHGQCSIPSKAQGADHVFACSMQSYAVKNGELTGKWGLKGYLFGTDGTGADVFQRIINGGKMTMTIGAVAVIISSIIGIIIGCISGYFGGKVDMVLMRIEEIFSAIPFLPFAMILSALMGRVNMSENMRIFIIMCILGVLTWPGLARLVRGQVLATRENEYVVAAQAMGVKESKIAFKHILPNVISVILVTLTLDFAGCLLTESSLSYLGFGVQYPRPTWGNMLNGANNATIIKNFWWQWMFPSLFLATTTICINIVGDTLRDVMDPKSNQDR